MRYDPISFSLMDSEIICNPKKMSDLVNNIGLRDASASKKNLLLEELVLERSRAAQAGRQGRGKD